MANRCGQDLAVIKILVVRKDLRKFADHRHAIFADVIKPANEWADQRRARLRGKESLVRREDQRAVRLDPLRLEAADGGEAIGGHWDLDHDVGGDLGKGKPLAEHPLSIVADHFGRDWAWGESADLLQELFVGAANLRVERRVGGDAVNDPPADAGFDLVDICSV